MQRSLSTPPEILLVKGTENERKTREQFLRLFEQYALDKWLYTERMQIEEGAIPHSHPILTFGTQYLHDTEQLLGAYIHEQIHWFCVLEEKFEQLKRVMETFRKWYTDLPISLPEGCGNAHANYLHIVVCYLEYRGLVELLGTQAARKVIGRITHYTKIYELILKDGERIGEVITANNLLPGEKPPEEKSFVEVQPIV